VAGYESGLSYEKLRNMADNNALDNMSKGTVRNMRGFWMATLSFQVFDADGGKKQARVSAMLTNEDGEKLSCAGRNRTTKTQAEKALAEWRQAVQRDVRKVAKVVADPTQTVKTCIDSFIDSKVITDLDGNQIGVRRSTATFYRNCAKRLYVCAPIANIPLNELTGHQVKACVNAMAARYSRKSVADALNVLDATCREVLGDSDNPCRGVEIPKNTRRGTRKAAAARHSERPNSLSRASVMRLNTLLDERSAKVHGTDYVALGARLALQTGMRCEEICGLRWRDVDFSGNTLYVNNVIERYEETVTDEDGNTKTLYKLDDAAPKTEQSRRQLPLTQTTADMLADHKRFVAAEMKKLYPSRTDRPNIRDLYVLGTMDGRPYSPHRLGANFSKFARTRNIVGTEGVTVTMHSLRHAYATLLHEEQGVQWSEISGLLGHADVGVTLRKYVGTDRGKWRESVNRAEEMLSARVPEGVIAFAPTGTDNE